MVPSVSPYRVYTDNNPLFLRGTIEPFYPSLVDELVKNLAVNVIKLVVVILYVQNHMTPLCTVAHVSI